MNAHVYIATFSVGFVFDVIRHEFVLSQALEMKWKDIMMNSTNINLYA